MTNQIQLRGHCQCCGHEQAVTRGYMAYHGYTVEHGFFSGKCAGSSFQPIEVERLQADNVCANVLAQCAELDQRVANLKAGTVTPAFYQSSRAVLNPVTRKFEAQLIPFANCSEYEQQRAIEQAIYQAKSRARAGRDFADYLKLCADTFHGKALAEIDTAANKPEAIRSGDRRISSNGTDVLKATRIERGRVYWKRESDGKGSWTGTQSWRKMTKA